MPESVSPVTSAGPVDETQRRGPGPTGSFRKLLVQDCGKYVLSQGALVVNGLVLIPALTHLFPPAVYGDYVLCSSFVNLGMLALSGWLAQGTLRFYPAYERDGREQFFLDGTATVALIAAGLAAIVGVPVILVLAHLIRAELAQLLWFTLPVTLAYSLYYVFSIYLRSARRLALYVRTQIAGAIIQPGLGLLALLVWRDIRAYFIVWLLSLCALNAWIWLRLKPRPFWLRKLREFSAGRLFAFGFPLVLSQLLTQVLLFADRYILEAVRNPREVGLYSLGFTVGQLPVNMLFNIEMAALYPLLMRSWERGSPEEAVRDNGVGVRYYFLIVIPSLVGLCLLSRSIVSLFSSREYSAASTVVPWVATSFFLSGLSQFPLLYTQLLKKPAIQTWVMAFAAVENVVLNLILIPRYGYYGAAVALLLSMVVLNIVSWTIGAKLLPISLPFVSLGRAAVCTGFMAAFLWACMSFGHSTGRARDLWLIPPAILVYFAVLYLSGEYEPGERAAIRRFLHGITRRRGRETRLQEGAELATHHRDAGAHRQGEEPSI
ncbi:MAG TPA: polysaccharide biosynthesis C-terminal domain-containing protein [Terracidiphilus sp.]|nr:polysaccharide biosynthesis C-terminal domain-containing protein [Terracidiphilus sp.]